MSFFPFQKITYLGSISLQEKSKSASKFAWQAYCKQHLLAAFFFINRVVHLLCRGEGGESKISINIGDAMITPTTEPTCMRANSARGKAEHNYLCILSMYKVYKTSTRKKKGSV